MKLESERLYYRELQFDDAENMYLLDSDAMVHTYLYDPVVTNIQQCIDVIAYVRSQYEKNGVGRMAAITKDTNEFIGWVGLKLQEDVNERDLFYDIGYRLMPKFWGRGYATEATHFFLQYAFQVLKANKVNAFAYSTNAASLRVLQKCGLIITERFLYNETESVWLEINKA